MRLFRFLFALPALTLAIVTSFLDRVVAAVAEVFGPAESPLAFSSGPSMPRALIGHPLDRSLVHSLRHEAGVPRRAAARNM